MKVEYLDFGRYHGKRDRQGSTLIRMVQMQRYWPELSAYKYGSRPSGLIFQKVYCTEDYKFPARFPGIKILDICDPDWLDGINIAETCHAMDAIVTPTKALADYVSQFHDQVVVIPDRFDIAAIPKPISPAQPAKTVVWFGYAHNAVVMKPAMRIIDELNLNLLIISNDDPFLHQWSQRDYKRFYKFVKYDETTIYTELQKGDFAILPDGFRPQDVFKSNNKAIKAQLAGLPVARTAEEVKHYMEAKYRQAWFDTDYAKLIKEYDVKRSVAQYKGLIDEIS